MSNPIDSPQSPEFLFRQAEIRAEGLIALLRLGISVTLAVAFGIAFSLVDVSLVDTLSGDGVQRWQVLYALGTMAAYFGLGVLCLALIYLGQFQHWMVWPSAAADCLFILWGTWLGLQNTGLTTDYVVVLPTLWLIPVVLACGVLRFNPKVQAFTILLLAAGLVVIGSAFSQTFEDPAQDILKVFFAAPPNLMRLVMICLAGVILVVATWRTRTLFLRTLSETRRRENLTRYVPAEVAADLAQSGLDALQSGQRQEMAVLFVDMRGFTARAETMPPEALGQFMTGYRRHISAAARAQGGVIDKFIGDAVLLVFADQPDAPTPSARALACAEEILRRISTWRDPEGAPVHVGIGLHFGEVFAGVIGDEDRLEYSVFGDVVNIAARLEELTKTHGSALLVTQSVLDNAGADPTRWHRLEEAAIRGRKATLPIYGMPVEGHEKTGAEGRRFFQDL